MKEVTRSRIERIIEDLPPLSPSVSRILELANDIQASPKDLLGVIRLDPVLTAKILKLVNSAFYGLPDSVSNVGKALILLGFNTIKNLALSTAVLESLVSSEDEANEIQSLWDHCLATSVGTKMLATTCGVLAKDRDEYFVAGLLHDIGRVVIIRHMGGSYGETMHRFHETDDAILDYEKTQFGIDHCQAGGIMCEKWGLPDDLTEVVRSHHIESENRMVNIVHLANVYCKKNGFGYDVDQDHTMRPDALERLGLDTEAIATSMELLPEEIEKSRTLLFG